MMIRNTIFLLIISVISLNTALAESLIERRFRLEEEASKNPFAIEPHNMNYAAFSLYETDNTSFNALSQEHEEINFQVSLKIAVARDLLVNGSKLYFAYTNQSWWQAFNTDSSSAFRETNHEPEVLLTIPAKFTMAGLDARLLSIGFNHQSNGRDIPQSRSWNRIMGEVLLEQNEQTYWRLKSWYRVPESRKKDVTDTEGDDNPNIERYLGNFELYGLYQKSNLQTYGLMLRNNLRSSNKGAIQLEWSYPLANQYRGYIRFFHGYGESLIDYNHKNTRISFGWQLSDWL